jgi:hypothetical protein
MLETILTFLQSHSLVAGSISGWVVLSFVVNVALAAKGPTAWVAYADQNPTVALIVNILFRDFGIDLVSVIQHIQAYVAAKAAGTTPSATSSEDGK